MSCYKWFFTYYITYLFAIESSIIHYFSIVVAGVNLSSFSPFFPAAFAWTLWKLHQTYTYRMSPSFLFIAIFIWFLRVIHQRVIHHHADESYLFDIEHAATFQLLTILWFWSRNVVMLLCWSRNVILLLIHQHLIWNMFNIVILLIDHYLMLNMPHAATLSIDDDLVLIIVAMCCLSSFIHTYLTAILTCNSMVIHLTCCFLCYHLFVLNILHVNFFFF